MLALVAERGCGYVLMHIEGPPRVDRPAPHYDDVVGHLGEWFAERLDRAASLGVAPEQIALDPGLDFDLTTDDGIEIVRRLGELRELGRPLFVALSRKDFLGAIAAGSWEERLEPGERGPATMAATALAVAAGAEMLRLHDADALDAMRDRGGDRRAARRDRARRRAAARLGAPAGGGRARRPARGDQRRARRGAAHGRGARRALARAGGGARARRDHGALHATRWRRSRPPARAT